jgi:D-amino-acid dehydrogenase
LGYDNLFVNTGHGHLGWTLAAGSAALLADLMLGKAPSLPAAPYDPNR